MSEEKNGEVAEISEIEKKIIQQIEYYFGDINLGKDKFLQAKVKEDDGWVTLETMITFHRLKCLSDDPNVIIAAVKKSTSQLMETDEEGKKIRRSPDKPLPEFNQERRTDLANRTVYAKGFGPDSKLDELMEFFGTFGKVEQVQMRRTAKKEFKGSCFVIYDSLDTAKKFLDAESVKKDDVELVRFSKDDYFKTKTEEKKQLKEETAKCDEEMKQKREEEEREEFRKKITVGSVLKLTNIGEGISREDIKGPIEEHGKFTVAWIEFEQGETEARVRFEQANSAQTAWDKTKEAGEGKLEIKGSVLEGNVLTGEEEEQFWRNLFRSQRERRDRKKGGRFQRGFKSQPWKRRADRRDNRDGDDSEAKAKKRDAPSEKAGEEPAPKVAKTEGD